MAKNVHNLFLWATSITPRNLGIQGWKHSSHHAEELPFECHWQNYCDNPVSEKYLDPNATRTTVLFKRIYGDMENQPRVEVGDISIPVPTEEPKAQTSAS